MEKSISRCLYEIEFDEKTNLPKSMRMVVLAGVKNAKNDPKLEKGEHVAFTFDYEFSNFGGVEKFQIPREVAKLIL